MRRASVTTLGILLSIVASCGGSSPSGPSVPPNAKPNFSLQDVNPNSSTSGQNVSPRDYVGNISAWYFSSAT